MYREETRRHIQRALEELILQHCALPALANSHPRELTENVTLLAKMLSDQLWFEGYELQIHSDPSHVGAL